MDTRYEPGLHKSVIHEAGDSIFIPADMLHQPVKALVARNNPNEEESVVACDPATTQCQWQMRNS